MDVSINNLQTQLNKCLPVTVFVVIGLIMACSLLILTPLPYNLMNAISHIFCVMISALLIWFLCTSFPKVAWGTAIILILVQACSLVMIVGGSVAALVGATSRV